jgi:hypothetical protein
MPSANLISLIVGKMLGRSNGVQGDSTPSPHRGQKALDKTKKSPGIEALDNTKKINLD